MLSNLVQILLQSFAVFYPLKKVNTSNPSSYLYNVANAFGALATELKGAIDATLDRLDVDNAGGTDLDAIADNFGLERDNGQPAGGYVYLWDYAPANTLIIPVGTQVSTVSGTSFQTTVDSIIFNDKSLYSEIGYDVFHPDHVSNVYHRYYALPLKEGVVYDDTRSPKDQVVTTRNITIQAVVTGRATNVDAAEITEVGAAIGGTNPITNIDDNGVTNDLPLSGGSDPETDDGLRDRIKKHLGGVSSSTAKGLEALALFPGIDDARVLEPDDPRAGISPPYGAVYLMVASARARYTPQWSASEPEVVYPVAYPTTLKEEIRNYIEAYRSVGVNVIIKESNIVAINFGDSSNTAIPMTIYVIPGTNLLTQTNIIESTLRGYLESKKIGEDLYKTEIIDLIRNIPNVIDIAPFEITSTRWSIVSGLDGVYVGSKGSAEGEATGRDGIIIKTNEIARPDRNSLNFKLTHDQQVR